MAVFKEGELPFSLTGASVVRAESGSSSRQIVGYLVRWNRFEEAIPNGLVIMKHVFVDEDISSQVGGDEEVFLFLAVS